MYIPISIELKNIKTGEVCEVYISDGICRWSFDGDYLLYHKNGRWSWLCSENGFSRVINFKDWRYQNVND